MYKETEGKLGTPPSPIRNEEQKPKNDKNEEWQRKRERNAEQEKRKHDKEQSRDKEQRGRWSFLRFSHVICRACSITSNRNGDIRSRSYILICIAMY